MSTNGENVVIYVGGKKVDCVPSIMTDLTKQSFNPDEYVYYYHRKNLHYFRGHFGVLILDTDQIPKELKHNDRVILEICHSNHLR